jgi:uncharacterized protein YbaR (Trm112 family)
MANGTPTRCCICGSAPGTEKVWFTGTGTRTLRMMCPGCAERYRVAESVPVGLPSLGE